MQGEWRQPGTASPNAPEPQPTAPRRTLGPAALHLGARRASFSQERNRARDIAATAKQELANTFDDVRFGRGLDVDKLWPLVSGIQASISRHPSAIMGVTRLRDRHEYTYVHSVAVCGLMISLARQMGLDPSLHRELGLAGLLHDIGKARVPTMLLDKPGPLTFDEKELVRQHATWGFEMLIAGQKELGATERLPSTVLDVCLHHHERIDGTGYPDQKRGDDISLFARMAAICDIYDSMTSARPYKAAFSPAEALEHMANTPGKVDADILRAFSATIGIFPVGSMVRLRSDRLAVVLDEEDADPAKPAVCPFFCIQTKQALPWRRTAPGLDPIVGIELPARWNLTSWPETRSAILTQFAEEARVADEARAFQHASGALG
jgi:putative nucleotidyltransferase with HDIG domain